MPEPKQSPDGPASAPAATPEPLSAVLAEMRGLADHRAADAGGERPAVELLRSYADRIEEAAARERDEDRHLAAIAESDEAFARCARCDRPERATGSASAMRDALERAIDAIEAMIALYDEEHTAAIKIGATWKRSDTSAVDEIVTKARSALAAPARNCDRFKTLDEAREAFQDLRGHKILADVELWDSMDEAGALVRWLFATAKEGGKE